MALFNFFSKPKTPEQQIPEPEERSITVPGNVVANWDSAFGYGREVDKLSVVYGCVNLRASTIASLPIQLNRTLPKGHEPAKDHPYYRLVTRTPNPFQTNYTFWHWVITQLDLFGNAYVQKLRRNNGLVAELVPLNPDSVTIDILEDGSPFYKMNLIQADGKSYLREFTKDQIIHFKGYSRNGIYGLSIIETFRTLFDGYRELEVAGTAIAKNAAKPSGVIYHPSSMREEELQKLKAGWANGFSGGNSGRTPFLPNVTKHEPITGGLTAAEAEYISQKQFTAQRIAADIFRVPLHMLGLTGAPTYASVEQQAIEWVQYGLNPIITNLEQQLQKQLLDDDEDVYVNFNVTNLLRGDVKTRIEYYKFALEHGVLTANQVNELEGTGVSIPADKGGDDYVRPLNFGPVGKQSDSQQKT